MSKYFKTKQEFDDYLNEKIYSNRSVEDILLNPEISDEDVISAFINEGYTDLNNLVKDGHAYRIGKYTNNGWLYEDEADLEYIKANGIKRELRKR